MGRIELWEEKHQLLWKADAAETKKHIVSWRMLEHNKISGFLPFDYYYIDNEIQFCYHYASLQRIVDYFAKREGSFADIYLICTEILRTLEKGREYLLDFTGCMCLPENVFWDRNKRKVRICFLPGNSREVKKDYTTLVEYLMQHTDHGDERLVKMIYGLYEKLTSEEFLPESLLQYLQECSLQGKKEFQLQPGTCDEERKAFSTNSVKKEKGGMGAGDSLTPKACYFLEPVVREENSRLIQYLQDIQGKKEYAFGIGEFTVGRALQSDICIPCMEVSRHQAVLTNNEEGIFIMDTASANGTFVNNSKISAYVKTSCQKDDIITFADISYKISKGA